MAMANGLVLTTRVTNACCQRTAGGRRKRKGKTQGENDRNAAHEGEWILICSEIAEHEQRQARPYH